jgi:hypothetical protein
VGDGFVQVAAAPDDIVVALKADGSLWLTHTRGSVTQLEPVGCGYQRVALAGASWELSPTLKVQLIALRDDGSLVAWPVDRAGGGPTDAHAIRATAAAPLRLGEGFAQLEMVNGQSGNRGPEVLAVDRQGQVWQRRSLGEQPPADPHDWLERVELPKPASKP